MKIRGSYNLGVQNIFNIKIERYILKNVIIQSFEIISYAVYKLPKCLLIFDFNNKNGNSKTN